MLTETGGGLSGARGWGNWEEFLREVEELHVTSGAENDVDHLVTTISKEKLRLYASYCNCQDLETFSSFCKKVLTKFLSTDSGAFTSSKAEVSKHSFNGMYLFQSDLNNSSFMFI